MVRLGELMMILEADAQREIEQRAAAALELGFAVDLAAEVADDAAEAGAQELELAARPLELMGMAVAAGHDEGALGQPDIGLAQLNAGILGEGDELLQCPV